MDYITQIVEYISSLVGDIDFSDIFSSFDFTEILNSIYDFIMLVVDLIAG